MPDTLEYGLLNFEKLRKIGKVVYDVKRYQNSNYTFTQHPVIQQYLSDIQVKDLNSLNELSKKMEPYFDSGSMNSRSSSKKQRSLNIMGFSTAASQLVENVSVIASAGHASGLTRNRSISVAVARDLSDMTFPDLLHTNPTAPYRNNRFIKNTTVAMSDESDPIVEVPSTSL